MAEKKVKLLATEGLFRGLSKQNLLFHQCVSELIDNAIAARRPEDKFRIDIIFIKEDSEEMVNMFIADNCKGMPLDILEKALQLGESATTEDRLNEHGFGLKNALATLSGENGPWKLWTRPSKNTNGFYYVEGPFKPEMVIKDNVNAPDNEFLPTDFSTLVNVKVDLKFVQTAQGRGAPASDLSSLREWLIEHLGVLYRGYLDLDEKKLEQQGTIVVSIKNDSKQVPPIHVPLANSTTEYFKIELAGVVYELTYTYGTLDTVKRDKSVSGNPARYYYQGNIPTQGIDIRLGKRTIATRQFEFIWKTEGGESRLSRHNNYNDFTGELTIPELPRSVLSTTNNKTDFNWKDSDWNSIFDKLNEIRPPKGIREKSEKELKKKWMEMLKATNPDENITDEYSVWPTGTRVDVYRETTDNKIIIYEIKVGSGQPIHLYQLKMYWDGLVVSDIQPREAFLFVEDFNSALEEMANQMNKLSPPKIVKNSKPEQSKAYNFKISKHSEKGL